MTGVFRHGDLRLALLRLLDEAPRHGYQLIRLLEAELGGAYVPSAGSIYPRLNALVEAGLAERIEGHGRTRYRLTAAGRAELRERAAELRELGERMRSAGSLAREIKAGVLATIGDLREQGKPRPARQAAAPRSSRELLVDLNAFVADVEAIARGRGATREQLAEVRRILREARERIAATLTR